MDGYGIYTWQDGRYYVGNYKNDKKEGYGVYRWADGRVYLGNWLQGKQDGIGTYVLPNGILKKAEFKNGERIRFIEDATFNQTEIDTKQKEI